MMLSVPRDDHQAAGGNGLSTKEEMTEGRPSDEVEGSRDGASGDSSSAVKRKYSDREPESPSQVDRTAAFSPDPKKERNYYDAESGSPVAAYPKHVIVPSEKTDVESYNHNVTHSPEDHRATQLPYSDQQSDQGVQVLTPDSSNRGRPSTGSYDSHPLSYRQPYHDVYRSPSYNPDMEYCRSTYGGPPPQGQAIGDNFVRSRRWACDVCNVATFSSYEEACAHEEVCRRRYHANQAYHGGSHPASQGYSSEHRGSIAPQGSGLGALYHASQEVVTPPTPHRQSTQRWGAHQGPPLPVFPHEQSYYRHQAGPQYEDPSQYYEPHAYQSQQPHPYSPMHHQPPSHAGQDYFQKRMLLAMPTDRDSLSDRQCYVRSEMVEIFAATDKDVAARHSKGAQKLVIGQVGIRCVHCSHLRPRDRAERAVCYPSSISRIYQTVADMQRFHFEQCREIPDHVRQIYKKLKTTRPRGVGSPQTYWMSSAKQLGLVDSDCGIRFENDASKEQISDMSIGTN